MMRQPRFVFPTLIMLALATTVLLPTGCVGYRLGSMLPPDIRTVHIPTFMNETEEPLIEVDATRAAISAVQRDGSLRIASAADADALLTVRLIDFRLEPVGYDPDRRAAANEYRMYISAAFVMTRRSNEAILAQSPRVTGETTFVLAGDLTSAKQSALPRAAEDLAQLLVSQMVETWQ